MKLIPTGIENFKELIDKDYYYVDKTNLIVNIINEKVVLYTRPRRFGKTLNMSMLYYFFSIKEKKNSYLFNHLNISKNIDALKHQNKYPTIFISLKDMKVPSMENQLLNFSSIIARLLDQFEDILDYDIFNDREKTLLNKYHMGIASKNELAESLLNISICLEKYYHQKVIILIDEYDVPLQSAYQNNYYDEMVDFLRSVFSSALKTNDALEKGIMTGCLRISKESIFTGLNNFTSYSILNNIGNEYFGFNENEVKQLLEDYQLSSYMNEVKEWYDGYLFGNTEIYNPWSTLMYVKNKIQDQYFKPVSFWANTSGNDLVVNYIQNGSDELHEEFEQLIQGQSLEKYIKPELTYREMDNINNIYSFLLLTGYLRVIEDLGENKYKLVIPNKEVYEIYKQSFMSYFEDYTFVRKEDLYQCLVKEDVDQANEILGDILSRSISYFDNQEFFYHGFLVGLFSGKKIKSNREAMHGRFDLCILPKQIFQTALILECKHSKSVKELVSDAKEGAKQIIDNKYEDEIINDGYLHVKGYGISFYKKYCYIVKV
ncbi:AAA family ATPase [Faecalibacillus intestinalis]|uniref:AAA family ATPase n=1 Tax=Faecalibacillus intestinalis TaxID=1982626 RepID=UPI002E78B32E|nr:AAA family ATPase [Faecalibacillus intestinalis]MEE1445425.1 AAA family ATPase [Faecalibacillus intestinalis]